VYPNKLLVLATALPVGILLGLVLAVARESSDERVEAEWSLLDLGDFDYLGAYTLPAAALSPNSPEE
jgi:capsular polysaccharide biosynthesis protein